MSAGPAPLVLGTAGHIDHGKTALVAALTGVDTDRLAEERRRGISIELGYAPLTLPGGRRLSVVDVPGHERFVRTMVAGATGVDLFLMTIAADDGVMPQTREHAAVLAALGVSEGVVAVTKADLMDPAPTIDEAAELLPGVEVAACSARTGEGVYAVAAALERTAARVRERGDERAEAVLHVDRAFTIRGAGTVVTGTLWSGAIVPGDALDILPLGRTARVRAVQVHDEAAQRAVAGQRVAVNLVGVSRREVGRGDVVASPDAAVQPCFVIDAALEARGMDDGRRVQVHHGTRDAPARVVQLGPEGDLWQLRLEQPVFARAGDRIVLRSIAPPDTLGGGTILDPHARKHRGRDPERLDRLRRAARGEAEVQSDPAMHGRNALLAEPGTSEQASPPASAPLTDRALALEAALRAAAHEPPREADLGEQASELPALRAAGRAVRVGRDMHAHPDAIAAVRERVVAIVEADGDITLARLRDELQTSRKYAQALLEHLDASRVTRRLPDDRRVLRRTARS